jgi:hypothetical protein
VYFSTLGRDLNSVSPALTPHKSFLTGTSVLDLLLLVFM